MPVDYKKILKFRNNDELKVMIDAYFEECEKKKRPLTITGLCLALDTGRTTLLEYEGGLKNKIKVSIPREEREKMAHTIKRAKLMCQNYAEEFLFAGKNVVGAIFNLKANYGWEDRNVLSLETPITGLKIEIVKSKEDVPKN